MDKKTLIEIFTMRLDGSTYQEIGDKIGFTKQHIEQELKKAINKQKTPYIKKYPQRQAVVKYMAENNLTIINFAKLLEMPYSSLVTFLRGKSQSLKMAMKISKCTDLTLEQVLGITSTEN